ncbi:AraC family transcriptional regulator [Azorhizobium oxalatiphilum]|uniref:AraC family transcriptional regulator n=1 Tax=Azorhizobium oxalatiphilum TaxID=980631 RepID=A0A917FKP0_9HYPH|nr:GlxA family transcriptional regulator [Azorhizobium oxalatiphilum]GGF86068.1 AraC family transcriptional regulator [Azorhizobium oxalatiphilum]
MRRVGFIVYPGFSPMGFAVSTAFEVANLQMPERAYDVHMVSPSGGPVRTSQGFSVHTEAFAGEHYDLLVVGGSMESASPELVDFVRQAPAYCRRIASVCVAAFVLAEAGLLDGRRATTHWSRARELRERYPKVKVEEDRIFISDGPVWTSAGMTAGIDLALAMIEEDLGRDVARSSARKLVLYHRRAGGQSQFSSLLELEPRSDRIQSVLTYARRNLDSRLGVEELAEVAHLSPRQFSRAFQNETGQTPAKAVEHLRLEAARAMMEDTRHSIDMVAQLTGFADRDRMRRAFVRTYGQPPQVIRRQSRGADEAAFAEEVA